MSGVCLFCHKVNMLLIQAIDTVSTLAGGTHPYTAAQAFRLRGEDVAIGQTVQLSTSQAARLIDMGLVQAAAQSAPAPAAKPLAQTKTKPAKPSKRS